jgi:hypothetical protein
LNVPAISVVDGDVIVIDPSAPVIGLTSRPLHTANITDPPVPDGPTPSGYVAWPANVGERHGDDRSAAVVELTEARR